MTVKPGPHEVRRLVLQALRELGAPVPCLANLEETILLDDGQYTARSYRAGDLTAMWLIEVGLVQFYDADGNMLRTINLFEEVKPLKMAA
jgi:hypothetical protein